MAVRVAVWTFLAERTAEMHLLDRLNLFGFKRTALNMTAVMLYWTGHKVLHLI